MYKTTVTTKNALRCNKCGDIIVSYHRHDFKWCKCSSIFVDGGLDYGRYGGNPEDMTNVSEYRFKTLEEAKDDLAYFKENPYGLNLYQDAIPECEDYIETFSLD
jgi:hypothetical protein